MPFPSSRSPPSSATCRRPVLVMHDVGGGPIDSAPSEARREAARQLLESFYQQIMVEGSSTPTRIEEPDVAARRGALYFLDLGMVGEVGAEMREQLLLLLMAFAQEDVGFLTDVTLMLANAIERSDLDVERFRGSSAD